MRDLTRAREDLKALERQAKQRLNAFLLRQGRIYASGKARWTKTRAQWLTTLKFEAPVQQIVLQEYIDTVTQLSSRVSALEQEMVRALGLHAGPRGHGPDGTAGRAADYGPHGDRRDPGWGTN